MQCINLNEDDTTSSRFVSVCCRLLMKFEFILHPCLSHTLLSDYWQIQKLEFN